MPQFVGDGDCDIDNNVAECDFDLGDCDFTTATMSSKTTSTTTRITTSTSTSVIVTKSESTTISTLKSSTTTTVPASVGNGICDDTLNFHSDGYDGGDCCSGASSYDSCDECVCKEYIDKAKMYPGKYY